MRIGEAVAFMLREARDDYSVNLRVDDWRIKHVYDDYLGGIFSFATLIREPARLYKVGEWRRFNYLFGEIPIACAWFEVYCPDSTGGGHGWGWIQMSEDRIKVFVDRSEKTVRFDFNF